jgi:hypothetical protein
MTKILLISILAAPVFLAARASSMKNARLGLKKMLTHVGIFYVFYLIFIVFLYGHL